LKKPVWAGILLSAALFTACASHVKTGSRHRYENIELYLKANPYHRVLKMSGTVSIKGEKGWATSPAVVVVRRPDDLRVTFFDRLGGSWLLATANSEEISVIIPSRGIDESRKRRGRNLIRLGNQKFSPNDFIRFIHPGLEREWLENRRIKPGGEGMTVSGKKGLYDFGFDESGKMKTITIKSAAAGLLSVAYSYKENGIEVTMNGLLKFHFTRIKTGGKILPNFFTIKNVHTGNRPADGRSL
jgi:hypothetical protein